MGWVSGISGMNGTNGMGGRGRREHTITNCCCVIKRRETHAKTRNALRRDALRKLAAAGVDMHPLSSLTVLYHLIITSLQQPYSYILTTHHSMFSSPLLILPLLLLHPPLLCFISTFVNICLQEKWECKGY